MMPDKTDLRILYELDKNCRIPNSVIAKKIGISKQAVAKRISKLIEKKIISQFMTIINMANFGIMPLQIYLSLHNHTFSEKKEFINYLVENPKVAQVAVCEGIFDIFFGINGKSQSEIDQELSEIYSNYSKIIKEKKIVHFVDTKLFTRDHLLGKKRDSVPMNKGFHSREIEKVEIKPDDGMILQLISENPRISFVDIGLKLQMSTQTVINRVKFLENNDIIRGYGIMLNEDIFQQYNVLMEFNVLTKELEKKLFNFFAADPSIVFVVKTLGEFDFSVILENKEFKEFKLFTNRFKEEFAPHLKSYIPLLVTKFPKLNFLPR